MNRVWIGFVLVMSGCGDPLKRDVEMFCSAVVGSTWTSFIDVGPYVARRAKTDEFKAMLRKSVDGGMTVWEIDDQVRAWMKQTGVKSCRTLEVIVRPRPGGQVQ